MPQKPLPRKKTHPDVEAAVLARSARRCALCFHVRGDLSEKHGQIAHLDQDRSNAAEDNLAWLCLEHHSLYDSTTKQHKNYTILEVKASRTRLYDLVAKGDHLAASHHTPVQQDWRLRDERYAVYIGVRNFVSYVLREDGKIQLAGPGEYRTFCELLEKAELLFPPDVTAYLAEVDRTARNFYVSTQKINKAAAMGDIEAIDHNGQLLEDLTALLQRRKAVFRSHLEL